MGIEFRVLDLNNQLWLAWYAGAEASSPNTPLTGGIVLGNGVEAANYKATAVATFQEFLSSNDTGEVSSTLEELQQPHLAHIFVKQVTLTLYCSHR